LIARVLMNSWEVFVPFSSLHLLAVAVCSLLIAGIAMAGRALRGTPAEAKLRKSCAMFATGHTIIMASAVYDVAVLGFRPDWRDLGRVIVVSLAYVAFVTPINLELGTNYGFIGNPPPGKTIPPFIDAMGPWPGRALIVIALAMIGFVVALLPWRMTSGCVELEAETIEAGNHRI
jgi:uncharacterized membrane protein YwaF